MGGLKEVVRGVAALPISIANVYFVGEPGERWALIDAGVPDRADDVREAAAERYGKMRGRKRSFNARAFRSCRLCARSGRKLERASLRAFVGITVYHRPRRVSAARPDRWRISRLALAHVPAQAP
jgi:hypothetical protein